MARINTIWTNFSHPIKSLKNLAKETKEIVHMIKRDSIGVLYLLQTRYTIHNYKVNDITLSKKFETTATKYKHKTALIHHGSAWTFEQLHEFVNKVATAFAQAGFKKGDVVALLMESRPEFVGIWVGLSKIGCVTSLLNTNLKSQNLLHPVTVVETRALIYEAQFQSEVESLLSIMPKGHNLQLFSFGANQSKPNESVPLESILEPSKLEKVVEHKGSFADPILYIFTSGTTGLPKAAIITNSKYLINGTGIRLVTKMKPEDRIYTPLPLYHFAGGVLGMTQVLMHGNSSVLRHKFSASHFWEDCVKNECSVAQYIGETGRYLLAQPQDEYEKIHKVRCFYGNGLRPQLWPAFRSRFRIKDIVEFYGATEGNGSIINFNNREGSCGFRPVFIPHWILSKIYPNFLIKVDENTGEPVRDDKGLCIRIKPGEIGQFVGMINNKDPLKRFDGYSNSDMTQKKIVRDVLKHGDKFYASGDLLEVDKYGYCYFRDRTGDNFRWKGENVSTGEIEGAIAEFTHLSDCSVYGVQVSGYEGRAGMAAIADPERKTNRSPILKNWWIYSFGRLTRLPNHKQPLVIHVDAGIIFPVNH
ncbi:long-chain fatty acid transport protein 4-like isoform X2 [Brevipalpus obovatus]|uniref:long-chain fatty acid transport protein 4-like isoform X2 n=1 Tax=Brevipalpus obovatus TaxID=246614 RepID=UPI003D9E7573